MGEMVKNPDPDKALNNLERFLSSLGARSSYYALLYENPHVLKTLVHLFGTSDFLSNSLINRPEILDSLLLYGSARIQKQKDEIRYELECALEGVDDYEEILEVIRQFRHVEVLRVGINDIAGELSLEEVTAQLSDIADVCVEKAMEISWKNLTETYGFPEGEDGKSTFLILGMGKLGGREINYYSDLDLIFIYSSSGETKGGVKSISNHEFFTKLAQRIISFLSMRTRSGILYQIDTRLRPSGNAGPLVSSLSSFEGYHSKSSWLWERFALLKARPVAGDPVLGEKVREIIENFVFLRPVKREDLREIDHLRRRMELELAREGGGKYNIKVGKGGIVDVEFIIQALQILHGKDDTEMRNTNSFRLLNLLQRREYLAAKDAKVLMDGYYFLRCLENRLRLLHDRSLDEIEAGGEGLVSIAKSMGYKDEKVLLQDYASYTDHIRRIYTEIFQINI
ncbi:MAG: bifunctional [glutamate--ammonia ligase]-adenylyl-L-tyrosine phosphorylase/[glutamate--ammonia-ligase] adenylyltransferase, partial [Candidatus Aenigmatarchaeota archaeon]